MGDFENIPYTNLAWVIKEMKQLRSDYEQWRADTEDHIADLISSGLLDAVWDPVTKTVSFDGETVSINDIVNYLQVSGTKLSIADKYARDQIDILQGERRYIFIGD